MVLKLSIGINIDYVFFSIINNSYFILRSRKVPYFIHHYEQFG